MRQSASGIKADANASGGGDSTPHGDEKSAVKNTAPDNRTIRSTSESTSMANQVRPSYRQTNGQGFQRRIKPSSESGVPANSGGVLVIGRGTGLLQDGRVSSCG